MQGCADGLFVETSNPCVLGERINLNFTFRSKRFIEVAQAPEEQFYHSHLFFLKTASIARPTAIMTPQTAKYPHFHSSSGM